MSMVMSNVNLAHCQVLGMKVGFQIWLGIRLVLVYFHGQAYTHILYNVLVH